MDSRAYQLVLRAAEERGDYFYAEEDLNMVIDNDTFPTVIEGKKFYYEQHFKKQIRYYRYVAATITPQQERLARRGCSLPSIDLRKMQELALARGLALNNAQRRRLLDLVKEHTLKACVTIVLDDATSVCQKVAQLAEATAVTLLDSLAQVARPDGSITSDDIARAARALDC